MTYERYGLHLEAYPWDRLAAVRQTAEAHPDGIVDISIGTPIDPTPELIQEALRAASDAPGYPTTDGTAQLREAIAGWSQRVRGIELDAASEILPTVGSKEFVASLPSLLGLAQLGLRVACPSQAYPTYEIGARLAGVECVRINAADIAAGASLEGVGLLWLNSPGNPTGRVDTAEELQAVIAEARRCGTVVAGDECYAALNWVGDRPTPSVLDPEVVGDDYSGMLSVYSLSKQSNLAGYRASFVTGDRVLIRELTTTRKHQGMIVPAPVQAAMIAALNDDAHWQRQRDIYLRRRELLRPAVEQAGLRIDHSEAGLYLWATRGEDCMATLEWLAGLGIMAGPGFIYGPEGQQHVRLALTAPDERIRAAAERLRGSSATTR